ncbi:MAG: T9SS type A sorting domain-containing protein [Bacteroidota bacterium]
MIASAFRAMALLLIFSFFNPAKSQNYRVLRPEQTSHYSNSSGIAMAMRVDSTTTSGNDTTFFLLRNLQQVDWGCFHEQGPSWMGDRVTIRPDGETIFYNAYDQPVVIKTRASLNEEWICYEQPGLSFRAGIISEGIDDILGISDSVKTISFQALNGEGQNTDHVLNDMHLVISKNHGLVKTLNLYNFPDLGFGITLPWISELTLTGYNMPETGIQNLTWKQVHDHNTGDELHTKTTESSVNYFKTTENIAFLLEKEINGDTIIYTWENKTKTSIQTPDSNTFKAEIDTITVHIASDPNFDKLTGVSWSNGYWGEVLTVNIMGECEHGITKSYGSLNVFDKGTLIYLGDTCFSQTIICGCAPDYIYYKGLGGPYYSCCYGFESNARELICYKKDGVEWGFPLDFTVNTTLKPLETEPDLITIFPNPSSGTVNIEFKGNTGEFILGISDMSGRQTGIYSLKGEINTLDISYLKHGIYMLKINTDNRIITRKLVIM